MAHRRRKPQLFAAAPATFYRSTSKCSALLHRHWRSYRGEARLVRRIRCSFDARVRRRSAAASQKTLRRNCYESWFRPKEQPALFCGESSNTDESSGSDMVESNIDMVSSPVSLLWHRTAEVDVGEEFGDDCKELAVVIIDAARVVTACFNFASTRRRRLRAPGCPERASRYCSVQRSHH